MQKLEYLNLVSIQNPPHISLSLSLSVSLFLSLSCSSIAQLFTVVCKFLYKQIINPKLFSFAKYQHTKSNPRTATAMLDYFIIPTPQIDFISLIVLFVICIGNTKWAKASFICA